MTQAEKICEKVSEEIRPQVETLANAVMALQEKIDRQIPTYKQMPLAQTVTVGTGERMLRQNPGVIEFRATVRDYAAALKALQEILEERKEEVATSSLDDIRARFRVG